MIVANDIPLSTALNRSATQFVGPPAKAAEQVRRRSSSLLVAAQEYSLDGRGPFRFHQPSPAFAEAGTLFGVAGYRQVFCALWIEYLPTNLATLDEAEISATQASLSYVSDTMPGIRRRKSGKGFTYLAPDGGRITDSKQLQRIRSLAIPPAYTDVWISPKPNGHIQATGRDAKGRKQYSYHPRWTLIRDEAKFHRLAEFARSLPAIRRRVEADLRKRDLPKERVVASVIWLLENTMIRVGNHAYARENKSFGLTTLRNRHLSINGSRMNFKFKGKSGKEWNVQLVDRRIVRIIRSIQELPGQHLFQYEDEQGCRHQVHSEDVNEYLREASGADFTSKAFRTWNGTIAALAILVEIALPESKAATPRSLNAAIDQVARILGNTRAVCRRNYIHPGVIASWEAGTLADEIARARRALHKAPRELDRAEAIALKWLDMSAARQKLSP